MENKTPLSAEHERPLSQRTLGSLYDRLAVVAIDRGRPYSIPESLAIDGFMRPVEFRYTLDPAVVTETLSVRPGWFQIDADKAYLSFATPHVYDEADSEGTISSAVDINIIGHLKGTDIEADISYRVGCEDFRGANSQFSSEYVEAYGRDGRFLTANETVLLESGFVELSPEERRDLRPRDHETIVRLLFAINNS